MQMCVCVMWCDLGAPVLRYAHVTYFLTVVVASSTSREGRFSWLAVGHLLSEFDVLYKVVLIVELTAFTDCEDYSLFLNFVLMWCDIYVIRFRCLYRTPTGSFQGGGSLLRMFDQRPICPSCQ